MNLRDRLNAHFPKPPTPAADSSPAPENVTRLRMERLLRATRPDALSEAPAIVDPLPLDRALPGETVDTPAGPAFRIVRRYPLDTRWGRMRLGDVLGLDPHACARLGGDPRLADLPPAALRFVDTETTGLAGGTGTYAFLIGVAELLGDEIVVTQYLLRDFEEEGAALRAFARHLDPPAGLVTFNGKSFDLPLLETRRIMNRTDGAWGSLPHFDLLHPSRRIWKMRLVQCALGRLETEVLGVEREADIEGSLIPQVYFDYLRTGDARELARVVEHNRLDILSMVALLAHAVGLYHEAPQDLPAPDLFSLGRMKHGHGDRETGREIMAKAVESGLEGENQEAQALWLMAKAHRQAEEWDKAEAVWERLVALVPEDPAAYIELAKLHEHRTGDLEKALEWVMRAKGVVGDLPELERREGRIRRKRGGGEG